MTNYPCRTFKVRRCAGRTDRARSWGTQLRGNDFDGTAEANDANEKPNRQL